MSEYFRGKASPMDWSRSPYQSSPMLAFEQPDDRIKTTHTNPSTLSPLVRSTVNTEKRSSWIVPEINSSSSSSMGKLDVIDKEANGTNVADMENNVVEMEKEDNKLVKYSPSKKNMPIIRKRTRRNMSFLPYSSDEEERQMPSQSSESLRSSRTSNANASHVHFYLPYILIGYVQFLFNLSFLCLFLYLLYYVLMAISTDIEMKVNQAMKVIHEEMAACRSHFENNQCGLKLNALPPALENLCRDWEICMKKDPLLSIGRAKVSAETFAEILNGFVERISYKSMIFIIIVAFALLFLSNAAFSFARSRYISRHLGRSDSMALADGIDGSEGHTHRWPSYYRNNHNATPHPWKESRRYGSESHSSFPCIKHS